MAVPIAGKVLLDTNVFIDYLRAGLYTDWVFGRVSNTIRFLSAVVLLELRLGADTLQRRRAVDRIKNAFPSGRLIAPVPPLFDQAGRLFSLLYRNGSEPKDRLGPLNDILIALTARHIGATVVTSNLHEFRRIAAHLPGLQIFPPH